MNLFLKKRAILSCKKHMSYTEITGQPCAGKSSFMNREKSNNEAIVFKQGIARKIFYFLCGLYFLNLSRSKVLFFWSMLEQAPLYFRINIFFNAVSKFGIFFYLQSSSANNHEDILVDEGISHLPFLFLNSDTIKVVDFISNELQQTNVHYLNSPGSGLIEQRLTIRGHKRLNFLLLSAFVNRINEIEHNLLSEYPKLCKQFKVFEDAASI
jgi:hypothetical protein